MNRPPRRALDGILLLDKPLGLSSNQALQQARRLFRAEKAGHTGSLDPLATGMLPICFGEATKLCGLLLDADKSYLARVRLGERTRTGDAEGEVVERSDPAGIGLAELEAVRHRFLGPIRQIPPMYSALKHEGRRLYELARAGEAVDRAPREVTIHELRFGAPEGGEFDLTVRCSKGTYVRTLAEDVAAALGQCAHLRALRRTAVDPFGGRPMHRLADLENATAAGGSGLDACLLPLATAVAGWPAVRLPDALLHRLSRGQPVPGGEGLAVAAEAPVAVMDQGGVLRAVARCDAQGRLSPRRWLGGAPAA